MLHYQVVFARSNPCVCLIVIRAWRNTVGPIRTHLHAQLQLHDAPLSLADLTRIVADKGERISDADAQVSNVGIIILKS